MDNWQCIIDEFTKIFITLIFNRNFFFFFQNKEHIKIQIIYLLEEHS